MEMAMESKVRQATVIIIEHVFCLCIFVAQE